MGMKSAHRAVSSVKSIFPDIPLDVKVPVNPLPVPRIASVVNITMATRPPIVTSVAPELLQKLLRGYLLNVWL